tara:strand:+ start:264 stop:1136 length:873 start_codon:yes stop_codon:yes gene_type:complete
MSTQASKAIQRLLKAQEERAVDDGSGDVVFALFLEPHESSPSDGPLSAFDKMITYIVNHFQPSPVMMHVELVVPCAEGSRMPVNFATYIGSKSGWQADSDYNSKYYLGTTANKWRAVPVFGKHAARLVREACNDSCGVEYSLLRYITAAWGVRKLSSMVPDGPRDPAHCATLVARMLKRGVANVLRHPSAWYGPATLYAELCSELRTRAIVPSTTSMGDDISTHVDKLLRQRDEDVSCMNDAEFMSAIRVLTLKASAAETSDDAAMAVMTQKQLANALFRWSVLRRPVIT